ncbi:MAG: polysaccharide lyase family 7 protein [Parachlamydiaceae bacterium]
MKIRSHSIKLKKRLFKLRNALCFSIAFFPFFLTSGVENFFVDHSRKAVPAFHDADQEKLSTVLHLKNRQPEPITTPGSVLNIGPDWRQNHFELQLAKNGEFKSQVYSQEEIAAGFEEAPYFVVVPYRYHQAVQFWVRVDSATTTGSFYPRSELRQVTSDGSKAAFNAFKGTYSLEGKTRITHLPPIKPEVVIAQLFDGEVDRVAIRTQVIKGQINLVVRINGKAMKPYLSAPYVLNTEFYWKIFIQNGLVSIYFNDMTTPVITNQPLISEARASWYFKAGCYSQTNNKIEKNPDEYVSVELRDLDFAFE